MSGYIRTTASRLEHARGEPVAGHSEWNCSFHAVDRHDPSLGGSRMICWLILSKQHGELCISHGARRTVAVYHSSKRLEHCEITQVIWSTLDVYTKFRNNMGSTNHGFGYDFAPS